MAILRCPFPCTWSKYLSINVWRDFRLFNVSVSNGTIKGPVGKSIFAEKKKNPLQLFVLPLQMLTLKVLSLSMHYLIGTWTAGWRNLNQSELSEMYKILSFLTKKVFKTIFYKSVDAILKDVPVAKTSV